MIYSAPTLNTDQINKIINANLFLSWKEKFLSSGCSIDQIKFHGAVFLTSERIHSIYLEVIFTTPESHTLIRSILLKGKAVVIIPLLYSPVENEPKILMVKQRRIHDGQYSYEFPSGKRENDTASIYSAHLELLEECGIDIELEKIKPLASSIVVCESAFDESVDWFYCKLSTSDLPALNTELALGDNDAGEYTYPFFASIDFLKRINSFQVKTGLQILHENKLLVQLSQTFSPLIENWSQD